MWAHIFVVAGSSLARGIYLYVFRFISAALPCHVPCPDGIKLQSLGNVRSGTGIRKMTIAKTSSS